MSLLCPPSSLFLPKTPLLHHHRNNYPSLSLLRPSSRPSLLTFSSPSDDPTPEPSIIRIQKPEPTNSAPTPVVPDEWGDNSEPEPQPETKFSAPDPPVREDEDEWGPGSASELEITADGDIKDEDKVKIDGLKRCLVDTVYGSDFGFRVSAEVRAEVTELVNQLEACNPTPNPTEVPGLLDGNWHLVYTAFSELLPLIAVGSTPLLKVEKISQAIDTGTATVDNAVKISSPFTTISFSAAATFDVRSPSRIQVQFKEATFKPPEIKSRFDLPENVDIFGQKIPLSPVQQVLNPVQEVAASLSRTLYGLPPLKVPIPGERSSSWLVTTYLDEDLRISRGDGGLFVLVRGGSSLLDQ